MHTTSSTLLTEGGKQLLEILNYFKEFYTCFHKFLKALSLLVLKFCLSFITITSHVLQCLIFKVHRSAFWATALPI